MFLFFPAYPQRPEITFCCGIEVSFALVPLLSSELPIYSPGCDFFRVRGLAVLSRLAMLLLYLLVIVLFLRSW